MKVTLFTATGEKKGTTELPSALFEAPINEGLMHQMFLLQESNRRAPIAHAKSRGEIRGSTRKLYQQKGTGRARRGSIRSPLLRGGGKAFGPKRFRNFSVRMPKKMRHAALRSCLSFSAKEGRIIALAGYPEEIKTKTALALLQKLSLPLGRRLLLVTAERDQKLTLSIRNIHRVKTLPAAYLNPEDVLRSHTIVFLVEALKKAEEVFGEKVSPNRS